MRGKIKHVVSSAELFTEHSMTGLHISPTVGAAIIPQPRSHKTISFTNDFSLVVYSD
jgi:hypothetical protein